MQRLDYSDYRLAMTELFAAVDPVGLVRAGAPADEYEPEIHRLLRWRRPVTPAEVTAVFREMFGGREGDITPEDAAALADGIAEIRVRFGYEPEPPTSY